MTFHHLAPLGVAVRCALLSAVLATPVLAQPAEEPAEAPAETEEAPPPTARLADEEPAATEEANTEKEDEGEEAQDDDDGEAAATATAKASVTAEGSASPVPIQPEGAGDAAPEGPVARFEVLPPSAYPVGGFGSFKTRGIPGGSLELDMQGLQWPYLPAIPGGPQARIGFSGSVWVDTSYQSVKPGQAAEADIKQWIQQSRAVLRFSPTWSNEQGWFVQAQGEAVLNNDQTQGQPIVADADDLYLKAGKWKLFDVQVGRFQGWEVYHLGMGLDLNTFERAGAKSQNAVPVGLYGLYFLWDRPSAVGNAAIHVFPTEFLRFELLGQVGSVLNRNSVGTRPVAILDFGIVKLRGGIEYQKLTATASDKDKSESTYKGAAAAIQVVLDPYVEFGGGYAGGKMDGKDRLGATILDGNTTYTYGGFANARIIKELIVGGGLHATNYTNLKLNPLTNESEERTHVQAFGAIQYRLFGRLYSKVVVAWAKATWDDAGVPHYANEAISGRLRLMYIF